MDIGYKNVSAWKTADRDAVFDFAEGYKEFLNGGRCEREIIAEVKRLAASEGFVNINSLHSLKCGDKIYAENRGKGIMLAVMGREPLKKGFNLVGAHVDSPRLDVKANPVIEDGSVALMKTHYYGGIKKYQWTAIPLSLSGVVIKKDGTRLNVALGTAEDEYCFTISDILVHLASEQMKRSLSEGVLGEELNVIIGGIPEFDENSESVKKAVLRLLLDKYHISEEELLTAELEFSPAFPAKDVGLDRSFVGAYAQDDRVCAYAAFQALLSVSEPEKTSICLLVDKEEIGSMGVTGMQSRFFENTIADMIDMSDEYSELLVRHALSASTCLSADVCAAFDPNFTSPFDKQNTPYAGGGIAIMKYTGARGKSGSSDASAELFAKIVKIMDDSSVSWQTGELGKVDAGGGGTIAQFTANLNMDTIDAGVPVLSMHSPFEVVSKVDLYESYRAYRSFYMHN